MVYFLSFDGTDDYVSLASPISLAVGETIEFTGVYRTDGQPFNMIIDVYSNTSDDYIAFNDVGRFTARIDGTISIISDAYKLSDGDAFTVAIERTATEYNLIQNGTVRGTISKTVQIQPIQGFGHPSSSSFANSCELHSVRLFDSGGDIHNWDPDATSGTGSTLEDTVGTNDGTLNNFPTDDSQWSGSGGGTPSGPYSVIVLAGQSNMVGRAAIEVGTDDDYTGLGGAKQFGYTAQVIIDPTNPLDHVDEDSGDMGLWLQLVKDLVSASAFDKPILIVPVARGATGFSSNAWNPTNGVYNGAVASINAAMATNAGNVLEAVFWHQGETDALDENANYLADITAMHSAMITDVTGMTADTPFIVGEIQGPLSSSYIGNINADLETFAGNINFGGIVRTDDLALLPDDVHFDAPSLRTMGSRYASEFTSVNDTTAPTFDIAPNVTATTENGHSIGTTLNEPGTVYGIRMTNGATSPADATEFMSLYDGGVTGDVLEIKSAAASNSATLTFSTGSGSTAYDYYIVAEDDKGIPNIQASPTLVEATTAVVQVPGISALTVQKDGTAVQAADWAINITLVSGGTEVYSGSSIASDASGVISAINTSSGSVGDAVRVEGYSDSNNYGFVFTQNLEDNA